MLYIVIKRKTVIIYNNVSYNWRFKVIYYVIGSYTVKSK